MKSLLWFIIIACDVIIKDNYGIAYHFLAIHVATVSEMNEVTVVKLNKRDLCAFNKKWDNNKEAFNSQVNIIWDEILMYTDYVKLILA